MVPISLVVISKMTRDTFTPIAYDMKEADIPMPATKAANHTTRDGSLFVTRKSTNPPFKAGMMHERAKFTSMRITKSRDPLHRNNS